MPIELEEEIWKDIPGYEWLYKISTMGNVMSMPRKWTTGTYNSIIEHGEIILKATVASHGYRTVSLFKDKKYSKRCVDRLVAAVFIPNPENKRCVNHKNGIKIDDRLSNLEWATHGENNKHAYATGLKKPGIKRPILQCNQEDSSVVIKEWPSIMQASKATGIHHRTIWKAVNGMRILNNEFTWRAKA